MRERDKITWCVMAQNVTWRSVILGRDSVMIRQVVIAWQGVMAVENNKENNSLKFGTALKKFQAYPTIEMRIRTFLSYFSFVFIWGLVKSSQNKNLK